ncbi:hypothetical protein [Flavobacterium sp.]|jgi:hypothetical protein|uniref:hypothetical protein n=1 Tax=Flavobacterium sp. TaxID=239 RepID=UPI0022C9098D|nr:hypothetical protein [Flavobacterium sp.]MCZ8145175.1 hypothetical protein [Flavobacterium sp.]
MMKVLLICTLFSLQSWSQASGSSAFSFTLLFDWKFPVEKIKMYVYEKNGNYIENVHCITNEETNSITVIGGNHYIVGVKFPTLVCVYEGVVYRSDTVLQKNTLFYLITHGMESLSLEEPLFFSDNNKIIEVKRRQKGESFQTEILKHDDLQFLPMSSVHISTEMVRLN